MFTPAKSKTNPKGQIDTVPRDLIIRLNDHGCLHDERIRRPYQTCSSNASASEHLHNICIRLLIFVEVLPNKCTYNKPAAVMGRLYLFDQQVTLR
jgi:hypothetical protein